jgi:ABC-type uncharacterized transport system ATPase subunit
MFGMASIIRLAFILIILVLLAGGMWHITNLKADLAISESNNKQLETAINEQVVLMNKMQNDIKVIQETNKQLAEQNERQKQDVANLANKFNKRDIGVLAAEKPAVVEKLISRGTKNVMRCLELASGAPLNDEEKNAKSPTEANRECPSLINPNYTTTN